MKHIYVWSENIVNIEIEEKWMMLPLQQCERVHSVYLFDHFNDFYMEFHPIPFTHLHHKHTQSQAHTVWSTSSIFVSHRRSSYILAFQLFFFFIYFVCVPSATWTLLSFHSVVIAVCYYVLSRFCWSAVLPLLLAYMRVCLHVYVWIVFCIFCV